ncbi:lipase family protein [Legionella israelensis]|uniref:lipase family protein n=1 Tax=Legionella israelensis TaxID=454 RepID=UPI00117F5465|nr:lipase family protein [Legionella israelensis]QDP72104.1 lipase family protein [Legionella israelensis]
MKSELKPELWELIGTSFSCSNLSYTNNGGLPSQLKKVGHIELVRTHLNIYAYLDPEANTLYIATMGSKHMPQWVKDDINLWLQGKPLSATNEVTQAVQKIMDANPFATVIFTGHSLGAAMATWFSSVFKKVALVFDNPGIGRPIDDSRVVSFQSLDNFVNKIGYCCGTVIKLAPATSTALKIQFFSSTC